MSDYQRLGDDRLDQPDLDPVTEIAGRYNTREIVEASEDILKSPFYVADCYTKQVEGICAAFRRRGKLTERQFYALAKHIAAHEED